MARLEKRSLDHPDETRPIDKGTVEVVELDGATVMRTTFQPGWRWSECVKPVVGTDSCQTHHVGYVISGRMHVVMNDGEELEIGPGEAIQIPPGHDAWIVGDETYVGVDFKGGAEYAKR
jgi:mannose-6-phosphate isomerase-like protein (cupin superfamily)